MRTIRNFGRYLITILGVFIGLIVLYLLTAFGLSRITVNSDFQESSKDSVIIFVMTNGVHTEMVLPMTSEMMNWGHFVNPKDTKSGIDYYRYVAFGWGDKGFYLETPTWADLKFKTAFNALFFLSSAAMHVTFYTELNESKDCKKIQISKDSYKMMIDYITQSFRLDNNLPILIKGASYGKNDSFYEAHGTYNLFFTSNTWTNSGLKYANLKACLWTPFDNEILNKY
ncbi:MAG TPA: TIGR02117 family protein [Prolixibacteraceae bacterium]|nr:TIGR02117 family protein [Prolixibacteraceae bacterium]